MRLFKQALTFLGTLVVLFGIFAAVAPKRASAIVAVATLVRDADNPARDTFQAVFQTPCTGTLGSVNCSGLTVPSTNGTGQTVSMLVIEYVSGSCPGGSGPGLFYLTNYSNSELNSIIGFEGVSNTSSTSGYFLQEVFTPNEEAGFSQPTRLYAAPARGLRG